MENFKGLGGVAVACMLNMHVTDLHGCVDLKIGLHLELVIPLNTL